MVRRLLLLNGLAILGVILFHSSGWGFVAMFAWQDRYLPITGLDYNPMGSPAYYTLRIIEQLIIFCLPAFMFVSGYFIAFATPRHQSTVGWNVVVARIKNLLIPYFLWSIALLFLLFLEGKTFSIVEYLKLLLTGGTNPAYYYVILLCQLYLISPFLVPLAKTRWMLLLIMTGLIQLITVQLFQYPVLVGITHPSAELLGQLVPQWFFSSRIFWFSFGIVTGFHLQTVKEWAVRFKWVLLGVLVFSFLLGIPEWELYVHMSGLDWLNHRETLIDSIYATVLLLSFIAFDKQQIPLSKQIGDLGTKSFGIYIVHSPVMEYTARAIYHLAPWVLTHQVLFLPIIILMGLGVPLLLMEVVKRLMTLKMVQHSPAPNVYPYLFG